MLDASSKNQKNDLSISSKKILLRWIDFLGAGALLLSLGLVFMGGRNFQLGRAKIEVGSLFPWVLVFALSVGVVKGFHGRSEAWDLFLSGVRRALNPRSNRIFWGIAIGFACLGATLHTLKHWAFFTHFYDHTYMFQSLWNLWADPVLRCNVCRDNTYFGEHASFSLFLLTPWSFLFRDVWWRDIAYFILQNSIFMGGLAWIITQGPLRERKSLWLFALILALCSSPLRIAGVWDFRENALAYLGFSIACVAFFRERWWVGFLGVALACLSKENMGIIAIGMSIPLFFSLRAKRAGMITFVATGLWIAILFKWIWPTLAPVVATNNNIVSRMGQYGSTPLEIIVSLATQPRFFGSILERFASGPVLHYLVYLLSPFIGVLFLRTKKRKEALLWMAPAASGILMNVLSGNPNQIALTFHYSQAILPFLIFGMCVALAEWPEELARKATTRSGWVVVLAFAFSGRWPLWNFHELSQAVNYPDAIFLSSFVPDQPDVPVSANPKMIPHLSHLNSFLQGDPRIQTTRHLVIVDAESPSEKARTERCRLLEESPTGRYLIKEC